MWANHHNRFSYIVRSDHILLFLNTLLLMCVAFIPFPTALLAKYVSSEQQQTAVAVYAGTLAVSAVFFTLLCSTPRVVIVWWIATSTRPHSGR